MNRHRLLILGLTFVVVAGVGLVVGSLLRSSEIVAADFAANRSGGASQLKSGLDRMATVTQCGIALIGIGVTGFGLLAQHAWKRRRTRTDACRQCGYARSGWASDRCPECGAVAGTSSTTTQGV